MFSEGILLEFCWDLILDDCYSAIRVSALCKLSEIDKSSIGASKRVVVLGDFLQKQVVREINDFYMSLIGYDNIKGRTWCRCRDVTNISLPVGKTECEQFYGSRL